MKKIRNLLIVLVLCIVATFAFGTNTQAASKKDVKAVKKTIATFMKGCERYNMKYINKTLDNTRATRYRYWKTNSVYGKMLKKLQRNYFYYDLKKVKVGGNRAAVTVRVYYYDAYVMFYEAFEENLTFKGTSSFDKFVKADMNAYYRKDVRSGDDEYSVEGMTVQIPLRKVNGKWKISEFTGKMDKFLNCDSIYLLEDYAPSKIKYSR